LFDKGEFSMKKSLVGSFICLLALANNYSWGQVVVVKTPAPVVAEESTDLQQIRRESQAFVEAFNKKDAPTIAALWSEDGEYIDDAGQKYQGRAAIEKVYAENFAANPKLQLRIAIDALKQLSPTTAIEEGHAMVEPAPAGSLGISQYMVIHVKLDGQWKMASVRDEWARVSTAQDKVVDFEWLIGRWSAEEHGAKMDSECRWVANKAFVERRYVTTQPDGQTISGVQIIGWNPQEQAVQSWNFSSDGGYATGLWTPVAQGWTAQIRGTTGDGTTTTSVNVLKRLDDNAYVWQAKQRTLGSQALPDSQEIVLKRVKTPK
jgi:uncharacterized protein (TIGR02246 family)